MERWPWSIAGSGRGAQSFEAFYNLAGRHDLAGAGNRRRDGEPLAAQRVVTVRPCHRAVVARLPGRDKDSSGYPPKPSDLSRGCGRCHRFRRSTQHRDLERSLYVAGAALIGAAVYFTIPRDDHHWPMVVMGLAVYIPLFLAVPPASLIAWRRTRGRPEQAAQR